MIRTGSYSSSMERKNRSFTQIKDVLAELFQSKGLGFHPDDARIWSDWERIVGDPVASHARPSWIQSGRLRVLVSDSYRIRYGSRNSTTWNGTWWRESMPTWAERR
ncbi:MAG: DUF721 domain-containing protein [Deltaproteobacteria bacterium]|nr:DUF721 domain-containing protein [Deltaproteobacteria bacterium]